LKLYQLKREQFVNSDIETVWQFFSSPQNLKKITPDYMGFNILGESPKTMYPGLIISYTVTPLLNIPFNWVTEITHVVEKKYFVDEQRFGPYKFWHHKHIFEEKENGVLMIDIVDYALPLGILGNIMHELVVKHRLKEIFSYRFDFVEKNFNLSSKRGVNYAKADSL